MGLHSSSFLGHGEILLVPSGRDLVTVVGDAEALPPLPALPPAAAVVPTEVNHVLQEPFTGGQMFWEMALLT